MLEYPPPTFCDYETGMLTLEPRGDGEELAFTHFNEMYATAFHEAGHAVVQYALGVGLPRLGMRIRVELNEDNNRTIGYAGKVYVTEAMNREVNLALDSGKFCWVVLAAGIRAVAGPAAERKYCIADGVPVRTREFW